VLHGGSDNKDSEVAESIRYGVGKINISSDMKKAFFVTLEQELKQGGYEPNALFVKPMRAAGTWRRRRWRCLVRWVKRGCTGKPVPVVSETRRRFKETLRI